MSTLAGLTMESLAFLVGRWVSSQPDETVEEIWTRVGSDAMMGMFCWSRPDGSRLFEFLVLEERPTGIALTMQVYPARTRPGHWDVGRAAAGVARMLYRREREDRLYAVLERFEDGRTQIFPWHYRAAPLIAADPV